MSARRSSPAPFALALALIAATAAPGAAAAGDDAPLPYALRIEVAEGTRRSPASLRSEIELALRLKFAREACVEQIEDARAPRADALALRVLVDDYREETRWGIGIVARAQPTGGHDPELDSEVVLDVTAQAELHVERDRPPVRLKTFSVHITKTPEMPGQDAAAVGRAQIVDKVVKEAYALLCKGSRRKLVRDIEEGRSAQPSTR